MNNKKHKESYKYQQNSEKCLNDKQDMSWLSDLTDTRRPDRVSEKFSFLAYRSPGEGTKELVNTAICQVTGGPFIYGKITTASTDVCGANTVRHNMQFYVNIPGKFISQVSILDSSESPNQQTLKVFILDKYLPKYVLSSLLSFIYFR